MPLRILVVDDEPAEAERLRGFMEGLGHEVRTAATGAEALQIADVYQPHGVLLDVGLPDISGLEVMRTLRLNRRTRGCGIILANPDPKDEDAFFGFRYLIDTHFKRPLAIDVLTRCFPGDREPWDTSMSPSAYWEDLWERERAERDGDRPRYLYPPEVIPECPPRRPWWCRLFR